MATSLVFKVDVEEEEEEVLTKEKKMMMAGREIISPRRRTPDEGCHLWGSGLWPSMRGRDREGGKPASSWRGILITPQRFDMRTDHDYYKYSRVLLLRAVRMNWDTEGGGKQEERILVLPPAPFQEKIPVLLAHLRALPLPNHSE